MPKSREQKEQAVATLTKELKSNDFGVLTDFTGLSMIDLDNFRAKAREQGVKYTIVKTALLDIAAENAGLKDIKTAKTGKSYALALGGRDEVSISKLIHGFALASDSRVNIVCGIINGEIAPAETVQQLAMLPSYEELMARVAGSMNAPVSNFVYSINYTLQSFYNVIKAIQTTK
ncbi:50S ribosomal protein L10 [candidate division Kazan bacterium]|uniref:Large ribosomal subunit protein uL10 n=1 Tax=candidate division Kazan bacterium TaxID=2202143 RepID=A0A420ZD59_UNCK3|nr:MAG: 50S ribosomal protein L10 [candidate division Kazan bacterium]